MYFCFEENNKEAVFRFLLQDDHLEKVAIALRGCSDDNNNKQHHIYTEFSPLSVVQRS